MKNHIEVAASDLSKLHRYDFSESGPCFAPDDGSYVLYDDLVELLAAHTQPPTAVPVQAVVVPDGYVLVPRYDGADAVVSALYRRFKDWSKRGFGPDDVTWCEVKADIDALISSACLSPAPDFNSPEFDGIKTPTLPPAGELPVLHDLFAEFCEREGYPSDGPFDAALRKAFDAGYQQGRAAGIEEAAKVCDAQSSEPECPERAQYCADAIRALNKTGAV